MSDCFFVPCCVLVDTSERGVVQKYGKFTHVVQPGLTCVMWPATTVQRVSIKVHQFDVKTNTKTKDNVTVAITTALQYSVDPGKVDDYLFGLNDPKKQLAAHVENVVRSQIPKMDLDTAFLAKDELALTIRNELAAKVEMYGIEIRECLMTDMLPDASVLKAMNEVNAARRTREANLEKAEAEKVLCVKRAEADAEAKHLSGLGTAKMRQAILEGFRGGVQTMKDACGLDGRDVIHMMLVIQYLDTLKDFASHGKSSIIVPHGPSAIADIETQLRNGFLQAKMMPPMAE